MSRNGPMMLKWLWRRLLPDRYQANGEQAKVLMALETLTDALKQNDEDRIERLRQTLSREEERAQ